MKQTDHQACTGECAAHGVTTVGALVESGIGRRTFLVQSALMAAAAALAACAGASDTTGPTLSGQSTINVNDYPALANVGGVAMVSVQGAQLAIVRTSTTDFVALSRVCPHQGGIVYATSTGFQCPIHGATFNKTGGWIGGQRTSSMRSYATSYDSASGVLTIG